MKTEGDSHVIPEEQMGGTSSHKSKVTNFQELKEARKDSPLVPSEGARPCLYLTLDFQIPEL